MRVLRHQSLRRQILVATVALLVPFTALIAWSASRTRVERADELREEAGSIAATAAASLSQYFSGIDSMASSLASHPAVMDLDEAGGNELLSHVLGHQPLVLNIVLTDRKGFVKASALPARAATPTVELPYIGDVVATGKPVVSELTTGAVTGKPTMVFAYPVVNHGAIVGVLGFGLSLERLPEVFSAVPLPDGSVVTMTDRTGHVLARSRDGARYIGKITGVRAVPPAEVPRTQLLAGLDGVERFYGNAPIERGPWLLSVGIPTSVAAARLAPLWRRNMMIAVFALLAFLLVSLGLSRMLSGGLDQLRLAAQRIADGDLSPPARTYAPNLEMAQLQDAFDVMATNLRDARGALDRQIEQERRMRETLQSLQRQVVRQERLAAVGVLVSGVAHELNNPLQAILGTAELLERQPNLPADALEEVALIKTQSSRAREIIRNLSRFSSQQPGPPALVDLCEVIAEVAQLRRRNLADSGVSLTVDAPDARLVQANFTELEQVLLNFVINAQQAIESAGHPRGRIVIRLFDSGRKVRLEVGDDGPGVTPQDEAKLFQPFFTTKPVGQGTGLGLSVSYGIVDSYGGSIGYHPNDWGGATFFFELPVADATTLSGRAPTLSAPEP